MSSDTPDFTPPPGPQYADDHATQVTTEVQQDAGGAHGKYLQLRVNDFASDPLDNTSKMTAFLRIGAADAAWETDPSRSKVLEKLVHSAGPPGGRLGPLGLPPHENDDDPRADETGAGWGGAPPFVDDTRNRGKDPTSDKDAKTSDHAGYAEQTDTGGGGTVLSQGKRKTHSDNLHTRGGWRDHSDGNRISTTWGDKVEVIRGNYKMVVLGRQDDPTQAAGWDASGSHIQDFGKTMPGASVRVEYVQLDPNKDDPAYASKNPIGNPTLGGAWHLYNTTENVVQTSTSGGSFYTFQWGAVSESTVGTPVPFSKSRQQALEDLKSKYAELAKAQRLRAKEQTLSVAVLQTELARLDTEMAKERRTLVSGWGSGASAARDLDYTYELKANPLLTSRTWARRVADYQRTIFQSKFDTDPTEAGDGIVVTEAFTYSGDEAGIDGVAEWSGVLREGSPARLDSVTSKHVDGLIASYANAKKVENYIGTADSPVGTLRDVTFSNKIESVVKAHEIDETVIATGGQYLSRWGIARELWFGVFSELFAIESNSIKGGLAIEMFGGMSVTTFMGLGVDVHMGWALDVGLSASLAMNLMDISLAVDSRSAAVYENGKYAFKMSFGMVDTVKALLITLG